MNSLTCPKCGHAFAAAETTTVVVCPACSAAFDPPSAHDMAYIDAPDGTQHFGHRSEQAPATALSKVKTPATALMIVGILGFVSNFGCCFAGHVMRTLEGPQEEVRPAGYSDEQWAAHQRGRVAAPFLDFVCFTVLSLICYPLVLLGAASIKNLSSYPTAVIGSVMAMLPCSLAFLPGLPIGIWALVTIHNPDVRSQFAGNRR